MNFLTQVLIIFGIIALAGGYYQTIVEIINGDQKPRALLFVPFRLFIEFHKHPYVVGALILMAISGFVLSLPQLIAKLPNHEAVFHFLRVTLGLQGVL